MGSIGWKDGRLEGRTVDRLNRGGRGEHGGRGRVFVYFFGFPQGISPVVGFSVL